MSDPGSLVQVRLLGVPVEVHRRAGEHQEALLRELAFVEHAQAADAAPARLQALTEELSVRYGDMTRPPRDHLAAAIAAGETQVDLDYDLPADVVEASLRLGALLDELDELCRAGDLLTVVTPPDLLAYRRWLLGEFVGQVRDGRVPQPWTPALHQAEPLPAATDEAATTVRIAVAEDLDLGTAPALRQQLVTHAEAGVTRITLDLAGCDFLDSTGLSLLVATHHRLVGAGGGLRVEGAGGQVRGILDMAGATEFFDQG